MDEAQITGLAERLADLEKQVRGVTPYIPGNLNYKSQSAIDPGHQHTRDSLSGVDIAGMETDITTLQDGAITTSRLANNAEVTNSTTLVTVFTSNVLAGEVYTFKANLIITCDVSGGIKFDMSGTVNPSAIMWAFQAIPNGANPVISYGTALDSSIATSGGSVYSVTIYGSLGVTNAGTLLLKFAQSGAHATASSIRAGSYFELRQIS